MTAIDVRYRMTWRDIVAATAAANRFSKLAAMFAAFGVSITVANFLIGEPTWPMAATLGGLFATGLGPGLLGAWGWSRRPELAQAEIHVEADVTGVRMTLPMSASTSTWALFRRVRETREAFILDFGTGAGTFVPRRVLSDEEAAMLRSLAEHAGVLARESSWRLPLIGVGIGFVMLAIVWVLGASGFLMFGPGPA